MLPLYMILDITFTLFGIYKYLPNTSWSSLVVFMLGYFGVLSLVGLCNYIIRDDQLAEETGLRRLEKEKLSKLNFHDLVNQLINNH